MITCWVLWILLEKHPAWNGLRDPQNNSSCLRVYYMQAHCWALDVHQYTGSQQHIPITPSYHWESQSLAQFSNGDDRVRTKAQRRHPECTLHHAAEQTKAKLLSRMHRLCTVWALLASLPHPPPLLSVSHVLQQHSATSHSLNKLLACVPLLMLILLSGMLSPMCPMPHTVYMANTYSFWEDPDPWSLFWTPMETARCPCLYIPYALIYLAAACSDSEVLAARCCVQDISASPQCLVHDGSSDRVSW